MRMDVIDEGQNRVIFWAQKKTEEGNKMALYMCRRGKRVHWLHELHG